MCNLNTYFNNWAHAREKKDFVTSSSRSNSEFLPLATLQLLSPLSLLKEQTSAVLFCPQAGTKWSVASCPRWATVTGNKAWYRLSTELPWQGWPCRAPTGSRLMNGRANRQTGQRRRSLWGITQQRHTLCKGRSLWSKEDECGIAVTSVPFVVSLCCRPSLLVTTAACAPTAPLWPKLFWPRC